MNSLSSIALQKDRLFVSGDLNFETVTQLWDQSLTLIPQCKRLDFDLSRVSSSNSAGIALMLEWIKLANRQQKEVHFHSIPDQLKSIADVSGLKDIFSK